MSFSSPVPAPAGDPSSTVGPRRRAEFVQVGTHRVERGLALGLLVVVSPVVAVGAAVVRRSSPGPALYRARRVGIDGRPFTMYKLRTMHVASGGAALTSGEDARVFPAGRWLRRLKLDELPQLINVVTGDMAFVGPRPEDPGIVAESYAPWMWETLTVRPGLTSPGSLDYYLDEASLPSDSDQLHEHYVQVLLPRKLAHDLVFVRQRTLAYQLQLVARTVAGIVGVPVFQQAVEREERAAQLILAQVEADENELTVDSTAKGDR